MILMRMKMGHIGVSELLVPFLMPLVWHGQDSNPRPAGSEADTLLLEISSSSSFGLIPSSIRRTISVA